MPSRLPFEGLVLLMRVDEHSMFFSTCPSVLWTPFDVPIMLQDKGVALHLRKAALHWTSDGPSSTLWSALLLHDLSVTPGAC